MSDNKPNILFIDDEVRILRSLNSIFRRTHNVYSTTNPKEFIDLVRKHHMHVVVSDQRMPRIKGTELLGFVKKHSPNSIRILLTGYADVNAILDSVNEGEIYRYITKPWSADELRETIRQATEIALTLEEEVPKEIDQVAEADITAVHRRAEQQHEYILALFKEQSSYLKIKSRFEHQYNVLWADDLETAYKVLDEHDFAVMISDVHFGDDNTVSVINALKSVAPQTIAIVITSRQDANTLISLINKGQVYRFLINPVSGYLLDKSIKHAVEKHRQLLANPVEQRRFAVESIDEEDKAKQSSVMSSFISRLRKRFLST